MRVIITLPQGKRGEETKVSMYVRVHDDLGGAVQMSVLFCVQLSQKAVEPCHLDPLPLDLLSSFSVRLDLAH